MIFDSLDRLNTYADILKWTNEIKKVCDNQNSYATFDQWIQINEKLRVIRLNKYNHESVLFETHRVNYDVHVTLKGADKIMINSVATERKEVTAYNADKDFALYECAALAELAIKPLMWVYLGPHEAHRNEFLLPGTEKFVFKIKIE